MSLSHLANVRVQYLRESGGFSHTRRWAQAQPLRVKYQAPGTGFLGFTRLTCLHQTGYSSNILRYTQMSN